MNHAEDFDCIAENIFFPIYEVIAKDILAYSKITSGRILDLGCGGGHLGLSVLKQEKGLSAVLLDRNPDAAAIAEHRAAQWGLRQRATPIVADVSRIPLPDGSVDLAVSRGSFGFWPDEGLAFSEILRVLSPGGKAYIGGGFGNLDLKRKIVKKMKTVSPDWPECVHRKTNGFTAEDYGKILSGLGAEFEFIDNEEKGFWILLQKPRRMEAVS
ncbi:class I SAM-dependent methyltransferase [Caproicibacter fermentans]|uniref:Class I SAM-dependent methyltransferase n=1 Tax=Caproicibacter fermentans TaxID=2576756 RepID=A0A7G8TB86_9FIRM|nr:class I SAM-dependent methyltransferase [Caproicibacter fermentans]QNK40877.1 class I SAM-dependent methyltransferase [Caproicibacter fermentans]